MSVLIDGQRPIGARARIIDEPVLRLRLCTSSEDANPAEILCVSLSDLADYSKPKSQGALLKAAVVCCGVVQIGDTEPELSEQLMAAVGGGIEIESWSMLPQVLASALHLHPGDSSGQGSGMGTSSILAGAVLAAIAGATGFGTTSPGSDLIQDVLRLEQMLTTGGGWQDQASVPLSYQIPLLAAIPLKFRSVGLYEASRSLAVLLPFHSRCWPQM